MLSMFRRKPRNCDESLRDLSFMLWKDDDTPTFSRELLDPDKLDFSLQSVRHLDEYLEAVHQHPPGDDQLASVVLRAGAYLGEVIRKHSGQSYHWYDFKQAARLSKMIKELGMSLSTVAVLAVDGETLCFPIGKVMKFIDNGPEDSTYRFAEIAINGLPE